MKPIDYLILAIIVVIIGSSLLYIRRAKKKGVQCIGCPDAPTCAGKCSGSCSGCTGCHGADAEQ